MGRYKTKISHPKGKRKTAKWLFIAALGVILLTTLVILSGMSREKAEIQVRGAPRIKVNRELFDFGDVKLGKEAMQVVVRVTNIGDQPLKFREPPYLEVLEGC
ncbi:MAG TPA: hypothetical protein VLH85_02490 [Levilinea sp.]|nr:hypothetical protein [Levilinea sp.]